MGARANCQVQTISPTSTAARANRVTLRSGSPTALGLCSAGSASISPGCRTSRRWYFAKTMPQRGHSSAVAATGVAHFGQVTYFFVTVHVPATTSEPSDFARKDHVPFAVFPSKVAVSATSARSLGGKSYFAVIFLPSNDNDLKSAL
jgi:hypothetical protein